MSANPVADLLGHIRQAAVDARSYVEGLSKNDFLADKRTQQATVMNLVIIGEAASKFMDYHAEFVQRHPEVPWRAMRGMRNRIAHGYFDIDIDVVWNTVQQDLQPLLEKLPASNYPGTGP
ncbi:MAG: DUF86 domain-containing protein [Burkholderiales bacterium]